MTSTKLQLTEREMFLIVSCVGICMGDNASDDATIKALYEKLMEVRSQGFRGHATLTLRQTSEPTTRNMGEPAPAVLPQWRVDFNMTTNLWEVADSQGKVVESFASVIDAGRFARQKLIEGASAGENTY